MSLDSKIPTGPLADKWTSHKVDSKLINPANKRKFKIIVVGSGLAGGSAAASLSELGYQVDCFCYQDSARRAHSIAAQGGINAAKNYQNDGDSIFRLFYDTIKGGDFRAREANVHRLADNIRQKPNAGCRQDVRLGQRPHLGRNDTNSFKKTQKSTRTKRSVPSTPSSTTPRWQW